MAKNPWLNRTWQLMTASGPSAPLLKGGSNASNNRFRLVAYKTRNGANYYKVKSKKGAMTKYWRNCVFVPRGKLPVALKDARGATLAPPGPKAAVAAISRIAGQLVQAIDAKARIGTLRLECDLTLPAVRLNTAGTALVARGGKKLFGVLRLFQVPRALGREALLVTDFSLDRGQPGGNGGGGSVHDHP